MTTELREKIMEAIDEWVRPALWEDDGDLEVVSIEETDEEDIVVSVKYTAVCSSCPSSSEGTLAMIQETLRYDFGPAIVVEVVNE
jgi:Fe-S cluster biogenesis protein NfuA